MPETLKTLEEIREINAGFPYTRPVREWKEKGGRVVAWQCTYVPEEVIWAAGMLPVRMTGDSRELELENANAHLYINTCSFCRQCLELGLDSQWDFLDAYVSSATCDGSRRLADVWQNYIPQVPLLYVLTVPRKMTERAHRLYLEEVGEMKKRMEEWGKVEITDTALRDAIKLFNRMRELLKELHERKKADQPPVTGAETLEIINASFRMPKDQFINLLERLLKEIDATGRKVSAPLRLMVNGSPLNNPEFIKTIEDQGAIVVIDEMCMGVRYWWDPVDTHYSNPLEAISRRYLNNFPCARMVPCDERFDKVLGLVKDYRVEGVVSQIVRYCVPYAHDQPLLRERLEAMGVPVLELDTEYGMSGTGQIRTRAQAFMEMLLANK